MSHKEEKGEPMSANEPVIEVTPAEELSEEKTLSDEVKLLVDSSPQLSELSDDAKAKTVQIMTSVIANMDRVHEPEIKDNVIEMDLMRGGKIVIKEATAYEVMVAQRQMDEAKERGKAENMLSAYLMVACSSIDDKPMIITDLQDRLTAHDFIVLKSLFCQVNLI